MLKCVLMCWCLWCLGSFRDIGSLGSQGCQSWLAIKQILEGKQAKEGMMVSFCTKMKTFWSVVEARKQGKKSREGRQTSQGRHDCLFLYLNENVFRSGRISSVYIVSKWVVVTLLSKLVNFECVELC